MTVILYQDINTVGLFPDSEGNGGGGCVFGDIGKRFLNDAVDGRTDLSGQERSRVNVHNRRDTHGLGKSFDDVLDRECNGVSP